MVNHLWIFFSEHWVIWNQEWWTQWHLFAAGSISSFFTHACIHSRLMTVTMIRWTTCGFSFLQISVPVMGLTQFYYDIMNHLVSIDCHFYPVVVCRYTRKDEGLPASWIELAYKVVWKWHKWNSCRWDGMSSSVMKCCFPSFVIVSFVVTAVKLDWNKKIMSVHIQTS